MSNKHIKHFTRSPAVAEKADRTARLSRIANQHADDGYSRRGNFGSSLVQSTFLMFCQMASTSMVQEVGSFGG